MIELGDVYKVVVAMVPLYVALALGYGSVRWWRMFTADHCDAINRFNCYFIIPFFTFNFTASVNPYTMNFRFLAGDVVAKAIVGAALVVLGKKTGELSWVITSFSLSSLNNTLVVGVPLLNAMYGEIGKDLVIQSSVIQSLLWFPLLLFMLEFWRTTTSILDDQVQDKEKQTPPAHTDSIISLPPPSKSFGSTMKKVGIKLGQNPNCYACSLGLIWALLSKRFHFELPSIMEGSILIMAKAGSGVAMFSMGLFMALQDKLIACGVRLTIYGMVLRFLGGPFTTAVGSLALGLRSNILQIAIVQAALPQAITAFVFAQEYGLHADILSTAVIFGTILSLPLLIAYYAILDLFL